MNHPLALVPRLFPSERFPSWVARIAAVNDSPLMWAVDSLGLREAGGTKSPMAYGLWLSPTQTTAVSRATTVSEGRIRRSLISAWANGPVEKVWLGSTARSVDARQFARRNSWIYLSGSHYCPQCLGERQGAWLLDWKLPWSFACLEHASLLRHLCPGCGQRSGLDRVDGRIAPTFPGHIPLPGHCSNPRPQPRPRATRGPCNHDLRTDELGMEVPAWLLSIQRDIVDATRSKNRTWWADLRVLSALALAAVPAGQLRPLLGGEPPVSLDLAWHAERTKLEDKVREGHVQRSDSGRARRTVIHAPTDPQIAAVMTAIATRAMESAENLAQFAGAARVDITGLSLVARAKGLSARSGMLEQLTALSRDTPRSWLETPVALPKPRVRWDPENLPPLLWDDLYASHLAAATVGVSLQRRTLRRFAVIYLYRMATECSWEVATEHFRDAAVQNCNVAPAALYALSKGARGAGRSAFLTGIHLVAAALNRDGRPNSYRATRAAATGLCSEPLPAAVYRRAIPSGVIHHVTDARLRYGALWVWTRLCSDDPINAPLALQRPDEPADRERFHDWQRRVPRCLLSDILEWSTGRLPEHRSVAL